MLLVCQTGSSPGPSIYILLLFRKDNHRLNYRIEIMYVCEYEKYSQMQF